jgi:BirA family biotin operon repressor/biotin-[acetyl-CoA-carboxylase] ligase
LYNSIQDTLIIGKKVIYLPTCHSTNDIAAEIVHAGLFDEGTIVITDNQVKGKGQRGTQWYAEPGQNLTFSVILTPDFLAIENQFLLSQTIALAVRSFVNEYITDAKIKWPNDIHANGRKVSGILIETAIQGSRLTSAIVGIGVNINQQNFQNDYATSVGKETGKQFVLSEAFDKLTRVIERFYLKLKSPNFYNEIRSDYLNHLYGYKEPIWFKHNDRIIQGTVERITLQGKLVMQLLSEIGTLEVGLKEIEWLRY